MIFQGPDADGFFTQASGLGGKVYTAGIDQNHLIDHVAKLWRQITEAERLDLLWLLRLGGFLDLLLGWRFLGVL